MPRCFRTAQTLDDVWSEGAGVARRSRRNLLWRGREGHAMELHISTIPPVKGGAMIGVAL